MANGWRHDHHPLRSEAIEADGLAQPSGGCQLLRGNTIFEPGGVDRIELQASHDAPGPVAVHEPSLEIRRL